MQNEERARRARDDLRAIHADHPIVLDMRRDAHGRLPARPNPGAFGMDDIFGPLLVPLLSAREIVVLRTQVSRDTTALLANNAPLHELMRLVHRDTDLHRLRHLRRLLQAATDRDPGALQEQQLAGRADGTIWDNIRRIGGDRIYGATFRKASEEFYYALIKDRIDAVYGRTRPTRIPTRLEINARWDGTPDVPFRGELRPWYNYDDCALVALATRPMVSGAPEVNKELTHFVYNDSGSYTGARPDIMLDMIRLGAPNLRVLGIETRLTIGRLEKLRALIAARHASLTALHLSIARSEDRDHGPMSGPDTHDALAARIAFDAARCHNLSVLSIDGKGNRGPFSSKSLHCLSYPYRCAIGSGSLSLTTLILTNQWTRVHLAVLAIAQELQEGREHRKGLDVARLTHLAYDCVSYRQAPEDGGSDGEGDGSHAGFAEGNEATELSGTMVNDYERFRANRGMTEWYEEQLACLRNNMGGLVHLRLTGLIPIRMMFFTPWLQTTLTTMQVLELGSFYDHNDSDDSFDSVLACARLSRLVGEIFSVRAPALRRFFLSGRTRQAIHLSVLRKIHASAPQLSELGIPHVVRDETIDTITLVDPATGNTGVDDVLGINQWNQWFTTTPQLSESALGDFFRDTGGDPFPNLTWLRVFPHASDFNAMSDAMLARLRTLWVACVHAHHFAIPEIVRVAEVMHHNASGCTPLGVDGKPKRLSEVADVPEERKATMRRAFQIMLDTHRTRTIAMTMQDNLDHFWQGLRRATGLTSLTIQNARINGAYPWNQIFAAVHDSMPNLRELIVQQGARWYPLEPYCYLARDAVLRPSQRCLFALAYGGQVAEGIRLLDEKLDTGPWPPYDRGVLPEYRSIASIATEHGPQHTGPRAPLVHLTRLHIVFKEAMGVLDYGEIASNHSSTSELARWLFGPLGQRPFPSLRSFTTRWDHIEDGESIYPGRTIRTEACEMDSRACITRGCSQCLPPDVGAMRSYHWPYT